MNQTRFWRSYFVVAVPAMLALYVACPSSVALLGLALNLFGGIVWWAFP